MVPLFVSLLIVSFFHLSSATDCTYQDEIYQEGEMVKTAEPCLNCTCSTGVLLCYLRVCTTILPAPAGCQAKKQEGSCCPDVFCDDKESTTNSSQKMKDSDKKPSSNISERTKTRPTISPNIVIPNFNQTNMVITSTAFLTNDDIEGGCYVNGSLYAEGSAMISSSFCEYCYCIRGKQVCLRPKCHLIIEGCDARYLSNYTCCPTHYVCEESSTPSSLVTTTLSTITGLFTTTLEDVTGVTLFKAEIGCTIDGYMYSIGDAVPSTGHCQTCYCSRDGIKCSPLQCSPIMDGCIPIIPEGHCCPVEYNCNFTQYESKHTSEIFNWGIGEVDEIILTDNQSQSTTTILPPTIRNSTYFEYDNFTVFNNMQQAFAEERYDAIILNEGNSTEDGLELISELAETERSTYSESARTTTTEMTTTLRESEYENNFTYDTSTSTTLFTTIDKIIDSETETTPPFSTAVTTSSTEDITSTVVDNITSTPKEVETSESKFSTEEITQNPLSKEIFVEENYLSTETQNTPTAPVTLELKRSRLEDSTRRLPPPFLFLGSQLSLRPLGRGGATRAPFPLDSQRPIRGTIAPNIIKNIAGVCHINGRVFMNGEVILHVDPCDMCRCVSGREICHREECLPPPANDCKMERNPGFCCPHYICGSPPHSSSIQRRPITFSSPPLQRRPETTAPPSLQRRPNISLAPSLQNGPQTSPLPPHHRRPEIPPSPPPFQRRPETSSSSIPHPQGRPTVPSTSSTPEPTTEETILSTNPITYAVESSSSETPVTTFEQNVVEVSTKPSFLNHLLSLMIPNRTEDAKLEFQQKEVIPGSLVGNSWGILRVSGCNVYGRYYNLHDSIPELSTRCKHCSCDVTGVSCNAIC